VKKDLDVDASVVGNIIWFIIWMALLVYTLNLILTYKKRVSIIHEQRLQYLQESGLVLELQNATLPPDQEIMLIQMGWGPELWLLADKPLDVVRKPARILNGKLLVYGGSPEEAIKWATQLSIPFKERVIYF
jgi:hypothetical protein